MKEDIYILFSECYGRKRLNITLTQTRKETFSITKSICCGLKNYGRQQLDDSNELRVSCISLLPSSNILNVCILDLVIVVWGGSLFSSGSIKCLYPGERNRQRLKVALCFNKLQQYKVQLWDFVFALWSLDTFTGHCHTLFWLAGLFLTLRIKIIICI